MSNIKTNTHFLKAQALLGYSAGALLLVTAIPIFMASFSWESQILGCAGLGILYYTPRWSKLSKGRMITDICVSIISVFWLFMIIHDPDYGGHTQYIVIILFIIGYFVAVPISKWVVKGLSSTATKLVIGSAVFTLFLAPIPFVEGAFVPLVLALIYPPLVFHSLPGVFLSFLTILGFLSFWHDMASEGSSDDHENKDEEHTKA